MTARGEEKNLSRQFHFRYMSYYCYQVKQFWLIVLSNSFAEVIRNKNERTDKAFIGDFQFIFWVYFFEVQYIQMACWEYTRMESSSI
jgi:hypothetical protein